MISKRKLALGAALVVVLALAGAAVAAAAGHDHGKKGSKSKTKTVTTAGPAKLGVVGAMGMAGDFAAAASYLGITTDALKTGLKSGKTLGQIADATPGKSSAGLIQALVTKAQADLAAAVTAGKLTQAQSDSISSHLTAMITAMVNGTFPKGGHPGGGFGPGFGHGPGPGGIVGDYLSTVTTYLGITTQTLMSDLMSGKSLAQIADATAGKSSAGLVQALVAETQSKLSAAVTAGKPTQAQADALSNNLTQRITALVNGTPPAHAYGGAPGGWGKHGGMPPVPGGSNA